MHQRRQHPALRIDRASGVGRGAQGKDRRRLLSSSSDLTYDFEVASSLMGPLEEVDVESACGAMHLPASFARPVRQSTRVVPPADRGPAADLGGRARLPCARTLITWFPRSTTYWSALPTKSWQDASNIMLRRARPARRLYCDSGAGLHDLQRDVLSVSQRRARMDAGAEVAVTAGSATRTHYQRCSATATKRRDDELHFRHRRGSAPVPSDAVYPSVSSVKRHEKRTDCFRA